MKNQNNYRILKFKMKLKKIIISRHSKIFKLKIKYKILKMKTKSFKLKIKSYKIKIKN